jgi:ADP-ribose pyrophosphatase YjhB (NUDIX family)
MRRYPPTPLVGVAAVVFKQGEVLLVRRAKPPRQGEWSLPGGLQKLGETVAEAAAREVLEETAVHIRILGVADVVDLIEPDPQAGRIRYHYTLVDLFGVWISGDISAGSDAAEAAWVKVETLDRYALWSETTRIIDMARAKWVAAGAP